MNLTTTLNRIRSHGPCKDGWETLLRGLGKTQADDEPLPYATILKINGLADAIWCCRAEPQYDKEWRLFAIWCARQVQHLMTDERSLKALDIAEAYANGKASLEDLEAADAAAADAAWADAAAARAAWADADAARAAASWTTAARAAAAAARAAAAAAWTAADAADDAATWADDAAAWADDAAAWAADAAAWAAAWGERAEHFLSIVSPA